MAAAGAQPSFRENERPPTATDYVFLTARAPIRPIGTSGLRDVVRRLIERTGVQSPSYGTHILRHSLATRLLREGATLDTIGAVLRHRDVGFVGINTSITIGADGLGLISYLDFPNSDLKVAHCSNTGPAIH